MISIHLHYYSTCKKQNKIGNNQSITDRVLIIIYFTNNQKKTSKQMNKNVKSLFHCRRSSRLLYVISKGRASPLVVEV